MNVIMNIILVQRITDTNKQNVFVIPKYWLLITQIKMFPIITTVTTAYALKRHANKKIQMIAYWSAKWSLCRENPYNVHSCR